MQWIRINLKNADFLCRRRLKKIFFQREEFVNVNENCFHLYEIDADGEIEAAAESIVSFRLGVERAVNTLQSAVDNPKNADKDMDYTKGKLVAYKEVLRIMEELFFSKSE